MHPLVRFLIDRRQLIADWIGGLALCVAGLAMFWLAHGWAEASAAAIIGATP